MDWLVSKYVEVRQPARYGSFPLFHAQDVSDIEDDEYISDLRNQIDHEICNIKETQLQ